MSHRNALLRCRFAGALAAAMLLAAGVVAQTNSGSVWETNLAPRLAVSLQPGEFVGHEQVIRECLRSGTNEYMFVVPEGLRTETAPDGMIALISSDRSYFVSLRIVAPPPASGEFIEGLRERVTNQFEYVTSLQEIAATVADREGTGFQLRQELPQVGSRFIHILWVPFKAGVLEFALNADNKNASAGQGAFDMILLTFRSNERGRIEIVRRSDKT